MELIAGTVALFVVVLVLVYRYLTCTFGYFSKQGIPGPRPLPIFGTCWGSWKTTPGEEDLERLKKYGKVFGTFDGRTPNIFITDPDLLKKVLVKEFNSFRNRRFASSHEVMRKNMSSAVDDEWKNIRTVVTPSFTSAKLKKILPLMEQKAIELIHHFRELQTNGKLNVQNEFDAYFLGLICDVAFGIRIDAIKTPDHPIVANAKKIVPLEGGDSIMAVIPLILSEYLSNVDDRFFPKEPTKFFADLCMNIVKDRKTAEKRGDFVDVLLEAAEEEKKRMKDDENMVLTDEVLAGQIVVFLLAGFTSSALMMTYSIHALATHQVYQQKLYEEVSSKLEKHGGGVTLEVLSEMTFLDMFLNEILRLYPADYRLERVCNNNIEIDGIKFEKGMMVSVPVYAIHRSEEFYPEPLKFDPYRFSAEGKAARNPYTFVPFGQGPRNCIGLRFATISLKLVLCHLVKEFKFNACKETPDPLEYYSGISLVLCPKPFSVSFERRQSEVASTVTTS